MRLVIRGRPGPDAINWGWTLVEDIDVEVSRAFGKNHRVTRELANGGHCSSVEEAEEEGLRAATEILSPPEDPYTTYGG